MWKKKLENVWYAIYAFLVTRPTPKKNYTTYAFFLKKKASYAFFVTQPTLFWIRDLRQKKISELHFFPLNKRLFLKKKKEEEEEEARYIFFVTRPTLIPIRNLLSKKNKGNEAAAFDFVPLCMGGGAVLVCWG